MRSSILGLYHWHSIKFQFLRQNLKWPLIPAAETTYPSLELCHLLVPWTKKELCGQKLQVLFKELSKWGWCWWVWGLIETAVSNLQQAFLLLYGLNSNSVGWFNNLFYNIFFPSSTESSLGSGIAFGCHISLASFNLEHFRSLPLSFTTLAFLKNIILTTIPLLFYSCPHFLKIE